MTDPRPTPPGPMRCDTRPPSEPEAPEVDVVSWYRDHAAMVPAPDLVPHFYQRAAEMLAAALEATAAERDRLAVYATIVKHRAHRHFAQAWQAERARADRLASERDRAHATLREIRAEALAFGSTHRIARLARERLENP
jgi:hypothetical protein